MEGGMENFLTDHAKLNALVGSSSTLASSQADTLIHSSASHARLPINTELERQSSAEPLWQNMKIRNMGDFAGWKSLRVKKDSFGDDIPPPVGEEAMTVLFDVNLLAVNNFGRFTYYILVKFFLKTCADILYQSIWTLHSYAASSDLLCSMKSTPVNQDLGAFLTSSLSSPMPPS